MTVSKPLAMLLFCTLGICAVQAEEASHTNQASQGSSPSLIDKTGRAINKGAKATADGAEYVAKKVVNGLETGARATERGLNSAAAAVGLHETSSSGKTAANTPPADSTSSANK